MSIGTREHQGSRGRKPLLLSGGGGRHGRKGDVCAEAGKRILWTCLGPEDGEGRCSELRSPHVPASKSSGWERVTKGRFSPATKPPRSLLQVPLPPCRALCGCQVAWRVPQVVLPALACAGEQRTPFCTLPALPALAPLLRHALPGGPCHRPPGLSHYSPVPSHLAVGPREEAIPRPRCATTGLPWPGPPGNR